MKDLREKMLYLIWAEHIHKHNMGKVDLYLYERSHSFANWANETVHSFPRYDCCRDEFPRAEKRIFSRDVQFISLQREFVEYKQTVAFDWIHYWRRMRGETDIPRIRCQFLKYQFRRSFDSTVSSIVVTMWIHYVHHLISLDEKYTLQLDMSNISCRLYEWNN